MTVLFESNIEVKIRMSEVQFRSGAYRNSGWSVWPNESFTKYRGSEELLLTSSNFRSHSTTLGIIEEI